MTNGTKLKEEISKLGLKHTFVSKKTGISYESLKRYFSGKNEIPEDRLKLICLTFGIDLKIFGFDDPYMVRLSKKETA